jgi:hypothetical protein
LWNDKRSDLGSNFVANDGNGTTDVNESRVPLDDLLAVSSALTTLGYNSGPYQGFKHNSEFKVLLNLIGISMTIINWL